jgi:hypothetical protein
MPSLDRRATRVPASAVGLPWIRYPRDPAVCAVIVGRIDNALRQGEPRA